MVEEESMEARLEIRNEGIKEREEGEEEEEEEAEAWWSDSEVEKTLERLGLKDGMEAAVDGAFACAQFAASECSWSVASRSCPVVPRFNGCPIGARNSPVTSALYAFIGVGGNV